MNLLIENSALKTKYLLKKNKKKKKKKKTKKHTHDKVVI
jgi:hypothetical protein